MKANVFHVPTLVAAVAIGGIGFGFASHDAEALPLPVASASVTAPDIIVETGPWRRQWRRAPYGPVVVVPNTGVVVDPEVDVDVEVEVGAPAVIVLPPPRPASCGQYRYWNGVRCVDARYNEPYLGPR